MPSGVIIPLPVAAIRHGNGPSKPVQRRRGRPERLRKQAIDAATLIALIAIPSVAITALFLGAAWAMWLHHETLADHLGAYGVVWAWGGYALLTGGAYAWIMRRFPPAILCAWCLILVMVLVAGWAHVSFGPAAITAAAGIAMLRVGGQ
jgi:membrane associated rhomboid family serine protease